MSPPRDRAGVVADVGPGVSHYEAGRNGSQHQSAVISGAEPDMLLIKPSWWGQGRRRPPNRRTDPRQDTHERGQALYESRPVRVTDVNPASQPQASHHKHLQALHWSVLGFA